jgi:hypothetical protein
LYILYCMYVNEQLSDFYLKIPIQAHPVTAISID